MLEPIDNIEGIPIFSNRDFYIENYQQIAHDHLRHQEETGENPFISKNIWQEMENSTAALILKYINDDDRILDVGVGTGRLLSNFPNLNRFGMDISIDYLKQANSRGIEICFSLIDDIPYNKEYFDLIVSTDVLEHVIDLYSSIEKILSCLKPGGTFIIRVPYKEDLSLYLDPQYPYKYSHLRTFNEHDLTLMMKGIFNCEFVEYDFAVYLMEARYLRYPSKSAKLQNKMVGLIRF